MGRYRPNPAQWVWYAFGGKLPDRYAEWVLHDVTCRTWVLRHLARSLTQMSPFCLLVLLPGPWSLRLTAIGLGLMAGLFYAVCFMGEMAEHRVIKHGYPPGIGRETRALYRDAQRVTKQAARRDAHDKRFW